ncbi:MAG TPA: glycosyltransferase [Labilithrix sp.]|nr:glycosyltransferase [Labilithrix sp.]
MAEHDFPSVTVAIATSEDEARIEECLRRALSQDYPKNAIEIVVADAMSMDATREIVLRVGAEAPSVRLVDNPHRTRAGALNAAVLASNGEIIVPMDPGGDYARTHVAKCVEALSSSPADHVAIVPQSAGRTLVERALSAVQSTKLAFAQGAELARGSEPVPALLGAVRRRVFDRVGLFDTGADCEEDVELSRRIARAGGALTVRRDIVVQQPNASSFKDLFRRHYLLGRSRARRTVRDRRIESLRELGPLAIVSVGAMLAVTSTLQPFTPIAAAVYALKTGATAVRVGRREGVVTIPVAWAAFPVMHVAHGVGFGAGLVRSATRPDWKAEGEPPRGKSPSVGAPAVQP